MFNQIVIGFDNGARNLEIVRSPVGPRLRRSPATTEFGVSRLVLPDAPGDVASDTTVRKVVLDLLPRRVGMANSFNQVKVTSTPASGGGDRIVSSIEFQGKLPCYLGVAGDLHVHGKLVADGEGLKWEAFAFHSYRGPGDYQPLQKFIIDDSELGKSFFGQPPLRLRSSSNLPFWNRVGLRHLDGVSPSLIALEMVPAPSIAPMEYTGENLVSQLVSAPQDSAPLVVRLRQHCQFAQQFSSIPSVNQKIETDEFRVELDSMSVVRAGLDRSELGVQCYQTQNVLDPAGGISRETGKFIWRIEGIPMLPMLRAYNEAARRYLSSLQTIQDGRPISGLPLIDDRVWDRPENWNFPIDTPSEHEFARSWNISLDVVDELDEAGSLSNISTYSKWKPSFRAAFPIAPNPEAISKTFKYRFWYPGLSRHDYYLATSDENNVEIEGVLALDCLIDRVEDVFEPGTIPAPNTIERRIYFAKQSGRRDSVWRGFVFRTRRAFRKSEDPEMPMQMIRVGALDLVFSAPLDLVDPTLYVSLGGAASPSPKLSKLSDRGELDQSSNELRQWSVITLGWRDVRGRWSKDLPQAALEWLFRVDEVHPGGQDGLPDEPFNPVDVGDDVVHGSAESLPSAVRKRFVREPALIIPAPINPLAQQQLSRGPYLLRLREDTAPMKSQSISMNLFEWGSREQAHTEKLPTRLVVIDRQPFMVALVEAPPLAVVGSADGNLEIGNWSAAGFEGASWELAGASDGFRMNFPPQAVGESMEKRTAKEPPLLGQESEPRPGFDIIEGKPAQFRLSPISTFELQSAYFRQNFTEAVWNLRRILGYPGQRAPGAGVRRLAFELLYGMGCEVRSDELRLAELSSRIGAVPKSLPQQISRILGRDRYNNELDYLKVLELVFQQLNYRWSRQYQVYLSRLAIYEPWAKFNEAAVTLKSGVEYELRDPQKITQDPTNPSVHNPHDPVSPGPGQPDLRQQPRLLAGGALWGFDFVSQYKPFKESAKTRRSTSGELSRPAFSALGGWGHQKAVFQNGLTTIYSDTAMGRTFFYSVERRGRIAGFWNFAKHVVIYERTVATAKQFRPVRNEAGQITGPTQDHLAGRPVLRKVQEFIEILQPRRSFPDLGGGEVARGCVQSIEFAKTIIPIDYRWGRDVTNSHGDPIGYVIPLWQPDADPVIYPKPQIAIRLAGATSAGESMACELVDPQKLQFYSQSDNKTDQEVNTDIWDAVRGVDFPDASWPAVEPVAPPNGSLEQQLPDEVSVAPGYAAFTYHIIAAKPVNVVANRSDSATAAMIRNVSMVRADPIALPQNPDANISVQVTKSQETMHLVRTNMKQILALCDGDLTTSATREQIKTLAQGIQDVVAGPSNSLKAQLGQVFSGLEPEKLLSTPRNWEQLTKAAVSRWVRAADAAVKSEFQDRLQSKIDSLEGSLDIAKSQAIRSLQESWDVFRLAAPAVDPGIGDIRDRLVQAIDRVTAIPKRLESLIDEVVGQIEQLFDYPLLDVVPSHDELQAFSTVIGSFQQRTIASIRQAIEQATDGIGSHLRRGILQPCRDLIGIADEELTKWRRGLLADLERPADELLDEVYVLYEWLARFSNKVDDLNNPAGSPLKEVRETAANLLNALNTFYDRNVKDGGNVLAKLGTIVGDDALLKQCIAAINALPGTSSTEDVKAEVRKLILTIAKGTSVLSNLSTAIPDLSMFLSKFDAAELKDKLLGAIIGGVGELSEQLGNVVSGISSAEIQSIFTGASGDIDKIRRDLQAKLGSVRSDVEGLLNGLAQPLAGRFPDGVVQKAGSILRLVRAFGDAPLVQGMGFTRKQLGYFYDPLKAIKGEAIDISPAVALVNRVGGHLKAMGVSLPTGKLLDKVLPPPDKLLEQLDFGKLLPDFAGMKLDKLLPELKSPEGLKDKVKITQSFDKQAGRGWVQADVRVPITGPSTLFDAGALKVSLRDILLTAQMRIEAGISGTPTHRQSGKLAATWDLTLGGNPLITFEDTSLAFDESGKTRFSLDPTKVKMNGLLSMLSDVLKSVSTGGNGFTLRLKEDNGMPVGVEALLNLPLPDIAFGACALANLKFGVRFEMVALPEFAIGLQVNVSEKQAPFTLTIFILGGGGWFVARGRYLPLSNRLTTAVSIGLSAGAMLAIAFGPAKGCVFAFFYVEGELQTDSDSPGNRQLIVRIGLLLGGDVDVCGLVTVSIRLLLEMEYDGVALTGRGTLSVRVKVCFFLTISFSRTVEKKLARSDNSKRSAVSHEQRVQAACDKHLDRTAA